MTLQRVAAIGFCLVMTTEAATGQSARDNAAQGQTAPASSIVELTYAGGTLASWRRVQTRSESGSREVVVETVEAAGIEGRLAPAEEIVVETNRTAPNTTQTRRDVFRFGQDGRRTLSEATDSLRETLANGHSRVTHDTSAPDINGRVSLTARQLEQTRSAPLDAQETDITLLRPDLDDTLRATERTEYTERPIDPGTVRHDSTVLVRDVNGRWQPIEVRGGHARIAGSERLEEETVQRPDVNGTLAVEEKYVSRRSTANGQEDEVIETHAPYADGFSSLALSQRVHRTTTATADGGRYTVEEIESRNPVAPSDPLRLTCRTVTTVRQIGSGRWVTERQVFERDVNGRLQLVINETEDRAGG